LTTTASSQSGGSAAPEQAPVKVDVVTAACDLIARGQFHEAAEKVAQMGSADDGRTRELKEITDQYEQISRQRKAAQEAAFNEQYKTLERLKTVVDLEKPPKVAKKTSNDDLAGTSSVKDPNEPNDVTDVLEVVVRAAEFADEAQKKTLLADAFVVKAAQKAMDYSMLLEEQGRWLDAYVNYYYWLQAIDPNNKEYSTRADDLLEKAGIAASFQDSPCETCAERYEGVDKNMFERSMEALSLHYVNNIDYVQMASKAIKRCELLVQVLTVASSEDSEPGKGLSLKAPEPEKVTAWTVALAGLRDEIEASIPHFLDPLQLKGEAGQSNCFGKIPVSFFRGHPGIVS